MAVKVLVDVCAATRDVTLGARYAPMLRSLVGGRAGPYEDARALLTLAAFEHAFGRDRVARGDLDEARRLTRTYLYHELEFQCDALEEAFDRSAGNAGGECAPAPADAGPEPVQLTERSDRILKHVITGDQRHLALSAA